MNKEEWWSFPIDISSASFLPWQQEDDLCKTVFNFLKDKPWCKEGHYYPPFKAYVTILSRGWVGIKPTDIPGYLSELSFKAIAPKSMIGPIIREVHNSKIGSHDRRFRTRERIRELAWWPSMDKDVKEHIAQCPCRANPGTKADTTAESTQLPPCRRPNERIHVVLWRPLPQGTSMC